MARGCFGLSRFHCRDNERFDDFAERGATSIADILFQLPKLLFQSMAPEFEQELMVWEKIDEWREKVDDVPWKICNLILPELFNFLSLFSHHKIGKLKYNKIRRARDTCN